MAGTLSVCSTQRGRGNEEGEELGGNDPHGEGQWGDTVSKVRPSHRENAALEGQLGTPGIPESQIS